MPHYITTHSADGQAIFSSKAPEKLIERGFPGTESTTALVFSTQEVLSNPSTEADIDQYNKERDQLYPNGAICPPNGTSSMTVTLGPNEESPMHRTMTTDIVFLIEGVVELHLDSGEKRTMKAGDSIVQRATMHKWFNVTPDNGVAKLVGFAVATVDPIKVGDKELSTEYKI